MINSNPDPSLDTSTKGMNEPLSLEEWSLAQLEDVTPVERERVSKHRAGRQPKMSDSERRRRARLPRQRIREYMDAKALERALNG
jgi:hypothetical protein